MTEKKLITKAYASAHFAADLTEKLLHNFENGHSHNDAEKCSALLEQARLLAASAQALEQLARGHMPPKVG